MSVLYDQYVEWFRRFYPSVPAPTREEWARMCTQPRTPPLRPSDVQWDYDREREGDAQ